MMVQSKVLLLALIFFTYLYGHSTASSPCLPASAGLNDEIRRYQLNNLGRVLLDEEVDSHHHHPLERTIFLTFGIRDPIPEDELMG
ncbi:unnamed protein product [Prunus armeniaca]|uniref:Uncharacterized protein n=1 Tax=Prunus armeniaca TaxID=36596 RepID=A0A6J5VWJ7_PRUAR|nr:unnamed protein product [Prunus armeniaca]